MRSTAETVHDWAREEFGYLELGDVRRCARVISMARIAAVTPFGTVARTFGHGADRQAAYDLLESKKVTPPALIASMRIACVERCRESGRIFVPIDGTSLTIVDRQHRKNFGAVGTYKNGARGLKVVTGIAVDENGTSLGICAQEWWTRSAQCRERGGSKYRPTDERESRHWVQAINNVHKAFTDSGVAPVCVIDREGDATEMLHALTTNKMDFIVRSSWDRRLVTKERSYLREVLKRRPLLGAYEVDVSAAPGRTARTAHMELRVAHVTLDLTHDWRSHRPNISIFAVSAQEIAPPAGEKPLHWILLTNLPIRTKRDALKIVTGYTLRWRIEEFHKAWKSGTCNVEHMQLRTSEAASTWATLLAAVAIRAERLKQRSRNEPEVLASEELTPSEIEALIVLKQLQKKKTETVPDTMPTLGQAILWMAHLGSYDGKKGERPGTITISRGLEKVTNLASAIDAMRASGKMR